MGTDTARIRRKIADLESVIRGMHQSASDDDRRAARLRDEGRRLQQGGRYHEGQAKLSEADRRKSSARRTRSNMWRYENELKGLRRAL